MMQETKPYSDYLIDLRFQGVNRLFILSFENNGHRTGYWQCFLPTVEIKGYNIMIDGRNFFDLPVKSNLRTSERSKLFKEVITQGCLLDYCYFNKYYKTIAIDLSKKQEQYSKLVLQEIQLEIQIQVHHCLSLLKEQKKHFRFFCKELLNLFCFKIKLLNITL